ncbi:Transmembrane protein [Phytophthora megakarya]|uniref:Transmembrane protein n=1 Tax=Phytophthora megakarya TaxID=4795 RepID=A0A225WKP5_9STRA|nr:Transmembrane protein [Phytophthora megakarya]
MHFSSSDEDDNLTNLLGFRPIVLYDNQGNMIDESLTLSRSRKEHQLPHFSMCSSRELDGIDAKCSSHESSQHQEAKTPTGPILQTQEYSLPPRSREREFSVGDGMFNYRALGSLRSGLAPIGSLSRWHIGLAATAFASGVTAAFMHAGYRPLLLSTLNDHFQRKYDAGSTLLDWHDILSVLLGLFSDCVPIYDTRRKAYIALGWIFSALNYGSVCAIDIGEVQNVEMPDAIIGHLLEGWSIIGSFALQLSWVAALALGVGFAQREALCDRGGLATLFLILWQTGVFAGYLIVAELQEKLTLMNSSAATATTSGIVLPFVFFFLHDDDEQEPTATIVVSTKRVGVVPALRADVIQLWEIFQEKVTYRALMFMLVHGGLLNACDPGVYKALASWSGFTPIDHVHSENPWVLVIQSGAAVVALLHAKWRLLSTAWRQLAFVGTGVVVIGVVVQVTVISTATFRSEWFFSLFTGLIAWPRSWISLFMVLTTTEVTHVGCEGVTIGTVLSGLGLSTSVLNASSRWISQGTNTVITQKLIDEDAHSTRTRILFAGIVYAGINLFAVAAIAWLPRSKLEAQQLRAFGGYSRKDAMFIVILFVLLLTLGIVANFR